MSKDRFEIDLNRREFVAAASTLTGVTLAGCTGGSDGGDGGDGGSDGGDGSSDGSSGGDGGGSTPTEEAQQASQDGKTVRLNVALNAGVWNLDPALWSDESSSTVGSLIYDEVIELTTDEELQPGLVEEVPSMDPSGPHFDYTLREGLTFHNGDEVTVEDFKYSVDWILNPDNNSPIRSRIPFVSETEIVGDRTLRLHLEKPFATLNWWLTRGLEAILPEGSRGEVQEGKGPSGFATEITTDASGVGTGPFKFVEWQSESHVLLEANEDYWMDDAPVADEIRFNIIPEQSTQLADLRSGNIDLIDKAPPKDFESLQGQPGVTAEAKPGSLTEVLYVNLMEAEGNPMSNVHNRRAVLFGIDAEEILDEIFYGQGVAQAGPWFPESDWTSPKLKEMDMYDPELAREELEKAGNPDGFEMDILATKGSWFKDEAIIIQDQLSNIGIDVSVTAVEKSTLFNQVYGTKTWHAAMEDWSNAIPVATYWLDAGFADNNHNHNNWHHAADDLPDPYEASGPPAPEDAEGDFSNGHEWYVSRLREAQAAPDEQTQKEIVWELEEYIVENALQIDIAYVNKLQAWQESVDGYEFGTFVDEYRFTGTGD